MTNENEKATPINPQWWVEFEVARTPFELHRRRTLPVVRDDGRVPKMVQ